MHIINSTNNNGKHSAPADVAQVNPRSTQILPPICSSSVPNCPRSSTVMACSIPIWALLMVNQGRVPNGIRSILQGLMEKGNHLVYPPPPNPKFSGGPPYMPSVDVIPELDRSSESSSVCPSSSTLPKALGAHSTPLFDASMLSPTMLY